jgi:CP family cyanate transporter-like MFS transporter
VHKNGPSAYSTVSSAAEDPTPAKAPEEHPASRFSHWYLVIALLLTGINLRPAMSSVAPILAVISQSTGLSSTGAGLLTTLPVLCFGAFAPLAPRLASRFGPERVVFLVLLTLIASLGARVYFGLPGLFLGTLVAGASIGVAMVLMPVIIKRDFGRRAGGMIGVYTMALALGAGLGAGLTVPVEQFSGNSWRIALAFWALPALLAAMVWWPRIRAAAAPGSIQRYSVSGLSRSVLAWQVTAFMGLQSTLTYCMFGWLPTILIDRGMTPLVAGGTLSLSIAMQLISALGGPWMASLGRDQRAAIAVVVILTIVGFAGCMYSDIGAIWFWAMLLGLGQGGTFSIGMSLIVLRAPNASVAASLSGMSQGIGYAAAALGPFAFGLLHDISHDWNSAAVFFIVGGVLALLVGLGAGRNLYVKAEVNPG